MNQISFATILIAAGALCAGAAAQSAYRCPDGSYTQVPCAGGQGVANGDARSGQQAQQTARAAQRDGKLADALEKERLQREAQAAPAHVLPVRERPADQVDTRKPAAIPVFKATAPGKPGQEKPKKKKAKKPKAPAPA